MDTYSGTDLVEVWMEATTNRQVGRTICTEVEIDCEGELMLQGPQRPSFVWETRIECASYHDMDMDEAGLMRIVTAKRGDNGEHVEVVDCLAWWSHYEYDRYRQESTHRLDVEWYSHPRLFFDSGPAYMHGAHRWFVDWLYSRMETRWEQWRKERDEETNEQWRVHSDGIRSKDRQVAKAMGVHFEMPDINEDLT
jgi:hypothetical protein